VTGLDIAYIPSGNWVGQVPVVAETLRADLVVLDAFPWGIRGEWEDYHANPSRFVTMARRLHVDAYLEAAGIRWDYSAPQISRIIVAEPLNPDYLQMLQDSGSELRHLTGRIRFPAEDFPVAIPRKSVKFLQTERIWVVVHTGSRGETDQLLARARMGIESEDAGQAVAVVPAFVGPLRCPTFQYFPAAHYYGLAYRVVTGAGYNSLAEMSLWPEKHVCIPFDRRYDDQAGRLSQAWPGSGNGAEEAASLISGWL